MKINYRVLMRIVVLSGFIFVANTCFAESIALYTTAKDTNLRLAKTTLGESKQPTQPLETELALIVFPDRKRQTMLGFGGAITDASAEVFAGLPKKKQRELLDAYFSEQGLNYNLIRTSIHSSDFSSNSYTYIHEGDAALSSFSIAHDQRFRLPMLRLAIATAKQPVKVFASPWSPPAFMKDSGNMLNGGSLLPKYYQAWANYYVKFIRAYEQAGVPIWGVTIQNEPMATQRWESNIFTASQERDFLKGYLGPTLKNNGLAEKKVIVWDHNRDLMVHRAETIFGDPQAAQYAWGIGYHWYEVWTGAEPNTDSLRQVARAYPDKSILFTEGTIEKFDAKKLQYWANAERYGRDMINDINAGTVGWTDWNILLDMQGGPNHVGNFCFAPIHADLEHGKLIYTPSYYYLGHFSKFIKSGARRIDSSVSQSFVLSVSFINPDDSLVTILMNSSDSSQKINYYRDDREWEWIMPARSMQTLVFSSK